MRLSRLLFVLLLFVTVTPAIAQTRDPTLTGRSGGHTVYGDVNVADDKAVKPGKPVKVDITLYTEARTVFEHSTITGSGRYRFNNVPSGIYEVVAEVEGQEVARVRVDARSPLVEEVRNDLNFEWKSMGSTSAKTNVVSAADNYQRNAANTALFSKAAVAVDSKRYDEGVDLLRRIVAGDPKDFQAWTELANIHLLQNKYPDAETEYLRAIDLHSSFFPALLNLGRAEVAQQKFDVAVEVLNRALKQQPASADANYFLGECYLQLKKGSLAVGYLNEAIRLDPRGMAEVHLRLAVLYNAAGLKDKAAQEYEEFLKQRPDYKERKKLEDYISANKKP